jgi:hypothetical protein
MSKYNIEGGIDFFSELYKSLDIEENEEKTEEDKNKCLISNEELTDKHLNLICGHKFNYIPLYNDLVNHKNIFNHMEASRSKLNTNEIRCPYCRKKQQYILPYYEELGLKKVNGVNFYDPTLKQSHSNNTWISHKCEYQFPNQNYDQTKPESETNSKYLNNKSCGHYNGTKIAILNIATPGQLTTYDDTKYYCYTHKKKMIKQYKLQQKKKEEYEKKEAKILEKQMKLLEKQNAKAKEKEEKQKAKDLKKISMSENVVLGPANIENQTGCVQILKTGPNKGKSCGCKIFSVNMCKRHYTLNHKELIINN